MLFCFIVKPMIRFARMGDTLVTRVTANTLDHAINPYCYRLYRVDIFHYSMQQFKPRNRLNHFRTEGKT